MTAGHDALRDIVQQQRVRKAVPCGGDLLVEMEMIRPERRNIVPFVVRYARKDDLWQMQSAAADATQVKAGHNEYFYLGSSEEGRHQSVIWKRALDKESVTCVLNVPRRILAFDVSGEHLVAVVGADPRSKSFLEDQSLVQARETSGETTVRTTRNFIPNVGLSGDGSILRLALTTTTGNEDVRLISIPFQHETELTGECAISSLGQVIAAGIVRFAPDGRRRYGILLVSFDLSAQIEVWDDDLDLSAPQARPGTNSFVCLGEALSSPGRPPRQYPVLIDEIGQTKSLDVDPDRWLVPSTWYGPDHLVCLAYDNGVRRAWIIHPDSATIVPSPATPAHGSSVLTITCNDSEAAIVRSAIDTPPEVVTVDGDSLLEHSTTNVILAPAAGVRPRGRLERVSVQTTAGKLGAWLCRPAADNGVLQPVLIWCHGGPTLSWSDWSWRWNPWPFVAEGYAVLMIDPPLSLGYGQDVVDAGWGKWLTGVAKVAVEMIGAIFDSVSTLDRSRVGVMGASFGGWLSLALGSLLSGMVRLVITHAAWLDLRSVARTSDQHWHWLREYGDLFEEQYDHQRVSVRNYSPKTVVRLSHGMADYHVPAVEAFGVHREFDAAGLDVELIVYPDEGHELRSPGNVESWFSWALDAAQEHVMRREL